MANQIRYARSLEDVESKKDASMYELEKQRLENAGEADSAKKKRCAKLQLVGRSTTR